MAEPTQVTQQQVGFAPEIAPYAQDLIGRAGAMLELPYQAYEGDQVAQFSPLQQQSYDYAQQLQSAPQLQDATALAGLAGLGGLNTQYTFKPAAFSAEAAQGLMSPYMQNVVDVQQQQAKRQADIAAQTQQAQAARSGAFGGGRDAIMRSQANAELQRNLQGIQATGLQNAYQQAQQQFNAQNQLNAQQQQFGASLGMQGLQTALQGAGQLGNLGQTQYAQNVGLIGLQNQLGLQQQQQAQNILNTQYQNYLTQQNYPYKQMGFMSDILRGVPLTTTGSTVYQAAPTMMQNLTSLGLGAYGLSSLFGGAGTGQAGKAAGGSVKGYAGGGSVTSREFKEYAVDNVPSQMLPLVQRNAQARNDRDTYMAAIDKMAEDAAIRRGIAGALPPGVNVVRAAGGGIVAFSGKDRSDVSDDGFVETDGGLRMLPEEAAMQMMQYAGDGATIEGGDASTQRDVGNRIMELIRSGTSDAGYTPMTAEQRRRDIQTNVEEQRKAMGPDIYEPMMQRLKADEAARAGTLEQAKGLAALKAMREVLQPGGFMRGLGAAGAAFGDSYGKALEADRAEKRYLGQMQFHLADARRKEEAGLYKDARADVQAAEVAKLNAFRAKQTSNINAARALATYSQSIRPFKITGGGAEKSSPGERIGNRYEAIASGKAQFMGKSGPDAAEAYMENVRTTEAARTGVRYTGPDKTFDRQVKLQELYAKDPRLAKHAEALSLAIMSGNKQSIAALQKAIADREAELGAKLPEVPNAPGKPGAGAPKSVSIPQDAVDYLKANPSARKDFDAKYGAGAAKQVLGE